MKAHTTDSISVVIVAVASAEIVNAQSVGVSAATVSGTAPTSCCNEQKRFLTREYGSVLTVTTEGHNFLLFSLKHLGENKGDNVSPEFDTVRQSQKQNSSLADSRARVVVAGVGEGVGGGVGARVGGGVGGVNGAEDQRNILQDSSRIEKLAVCF